MQLFHDKYLHDVIMEDLASGILIYRAICLARAVDDAEAQLVSTGEAYFHVSAAGHEGLATLALSLTDVDWLHAHYRDKALILARGTSVREFLDAALCNADSHSAGRQMSAHMSDPTHNLLSIVGPVGNNALQAVGIAAEVKHQSDSPIVICCLGDGTSQQGEVLEAIAEARRDKVPVLFVVEDNGYSISTPTKHKTFLDTSEGTVSSFHGISVFRIEGHDPLPCVDSFRKIVERMRVDRLPVIVHFVVERLANHTNNDNEHIYRNAEEIARARNNADPLTNCRKSLLAIGASEAELLGVERDAQNAVRHALIEARLVSPPTSAFTAKSDIKPTRRSQVEYSGTRLNRLSVDSKYRNSEMPDPIRSERDSISMLESLREVLRERLLSDPRVSLFGQDIEDPKGDVFGLTQGLSTAFPGRVVNAPLSESTIVGKSIGRALAGGKPVACIQFADFLPLAFNQICSELGSMYWRTRGNWQCPVIILAPCGGYRPGLGPFHAQTMESILAHVPGIDIVMPSTAGDAAGLLQAAFDSDRPTIFLYPKVCLNDPDRSTSLDISNHYVPLGRARFVTKGNDLTLVSYGGTMQLCEKVAASLSAAEKSIDLIDLRSISPWDQETVLASVGRTGKLLVVHEDNATCGFASEIIATVCESLGTQCECKRVTRTDAYVPCNYANQLDVLPNFQRILEAAAELLHLTLRWLPSETTDVGELLIVEARGSSPADQTLIVNRWLVRPGDNIGNGQLIAEVEAEKAVFEICSPFAGVVDSLVVNEGTEVRIGSPLLYLRPTNGQTNNYQSSPPKLVPNFTSKKSPAWRRTVSSVPVGIIDIAAVQGSRIVSNEELVRRFPGRTSEDIFQRTGIQSRRWISADESALTMAAEAVRRVLDQQGLRWNEIDAVICSSTTPTAVTPSTACLIVNELCKNTKLPDIPAWDISAACAGYLYALGSAYDFLQTRPESQVLVVTTEALSTVLDLNNFDTAILFGDAATATVVSNRYQLTPGRWNLRQPLLGSKAESGANLSVGWAGKSLVQMEGPKVFGEAVRTLSAITCRVCDEAGLTIDDVELVVPHQANARIIDAVGNRLSLRRERLLNSIETTGNTSSSSIPLALTLLTGEWPSRAVLCAFGGGFVSGAAIVDSYFSGDKP